MKENKIEINLDDLSPEILEYLKLNIPTVKNECELIEDDLLFKKEEDFKEYIINKYYSPNFSFGTKLDKSNSEIYKFLKKNYNIKEIVFIDRNVIQHLGSNFFITDFNINSINNSDVLYVKNVYSHNDELYIRGLKFNYNEILLKDLYNRFNDINVSLPTKSIRNKKNNLSDLLSIILNVKNIEIKIGNAVDVCKTKDLKIISNLEKLTIHNISIDGEITYSNPEEKLFIISENIDFIVSSLI